MQWKARYIDGQELWETPESSTAQLDRSLLASFELIESGMVIHRWTFNHPISFEYRLRTRIPLLEDAEPETVRLVRYGDCMTYIWPDHTETVSDLSDL